METTTAKQPSFFDTVGNWVTTAGNIFSSGADLYIGAQQRLAALRSIDEDSGSQAAQAQPPAVDPGNKKMPEWVMPAVAVGLVIVGILVARKLR
jgi:hypothetical protein